MSGQILGTLVLGATLTSSVMMSDASAMPVHFATDAGASSVTLTDQSGGGILCQWTDCSLSASLASSFAGTSFTLDTDPSEGPTSYTFDFIRLEGDGTTLSGRDFTIEAALTMDPPGSTASSGGSGSGFILFGSVIGGILTWDNMPQFFSLNDGTQYSVSFEQGASLLFDGDAGHTLSATVELVSSMPLGSGVLFLGTALVGFGAARTVRKPRKAD